MGTGPSPASVAEAGPRWDTQTFGADQAMDAHELAEREARLAETDGLRPALQAPAPAELTAEGIPVTRTPIPTCVRLRVLAATARDVELMDSHGARGVD